MPTRIKRYEERAERLDELLARIEAEMGPEAVVERRDFTRGKVLGLFGGVRMVEIVATLEIDTDAHPSAGGGPAAAPPPVYTVPPRIPVQAADPAPAAQIDLHADAQTLSTELWDTAADGAPAVTQAPVQHTTPPEAAAPVPSEPAAIAAAPQLPGGLVELQESIAELQDTMRQLLQQQKDLLTAPPPQARPAAAEQADVISELEAEIALEAAQAQAHGVDGAAHETRVVDPLGLDPAAMLASAQRSAYDKLLEWNIGPYDALELLNTALAMGGEAPQSYDELLTRITRDICRNILLSGGIQLRKSPPGKVVALAGATGVGKTTTIAKLAANFAFQEGKRVSLISLDNYRIAAAEQLRTYTDIMGIDLDIVFSRDELDQVLTARRQNDLVLIDTAGRSPLNTKQIYELRDMFSAHPPDEVHLVIAAQTKADDMRLILENFLPLSYDYIILSKLDETRSLGSLYNISKYAPAIAGRQLPVSYFTVGQSVPEDIRTAELGFIQSWIEQGRVT